MGVMGGIVTCQAFEKEDKRLGRCRDEKLMLNAIVVQLYHCVLQSREVFSADRQTGSLTNEAGRQAGQRSRTLLVKEVSI
jgi:hypothetical protein